MFEILVGLGVLWIMWLVISIIDLKERENKRSK